MEEKYFTGKFHLVILASILFFVFRFSRNTEIYFLFICSIEPITITYQNSVRERLVEAV